MPADRTNPELQQPRLPLIKPRDQASLLALAASLLVLMVSYWTYRGGPRGELIHIDRAPPLTAKYQVDVNRADCSADTLSQVLNWTMPFLKCERTNLAC